MATSKHSQIFFNNYPQNYPVYMSGKLSYKVKLKKDFVRKDGTCAAYVQLFLNGKKMIPLNFSVKISDFDDNKQRVKNSHVYSKDYNLLIEKLLADINTIEVNYRLAGKVLTIENLIEDLTNPTARIDFIKFWRDEMVQQKKILKPGTYRQQQTMLNKLEKFKSPIFFYEIDENLIENLKSYCKKELKNTDSTVSSLIKSFKKYLHIANKKKISTPVQFDEIKNKSFKGNRTFLVQNEIILLHEYWCSKFINDTHKNILSLFLFSCFTGIRFSDTIELKPENFIENFVAFTAGKTGKFQRIPLNETAKKYIQNPNIFKEVYTNEYTNRELKNICKIVGIRKKVSFHVSRHTFATNFYLVTKDVLQLQKLLGHSKIEDTMIYVHICENFTNSQVLDMDQILNKF